MLAHRLALETGWGPDVDALMHQTSMRQAMDWMAYWQLSEQYAQERHEQEEHERRSKEIAKNPQSAGM